jgi:adenylate cyclase
VKNIAHPVRAFRVTDLPAAVAAPKPVSDKPSIAVLPFTNMSGDPEQEYFSDGITEDIITDLSKVSALRVLSRNTVFAYKGKAIEIGKLARQINVGHVVEGSVRKSGGRLRITAQLIDAAIDSHIWAERYDRDVRDIFALQDEVSRAIVAALKVKLLPEEEKAIEKRSTHDPEAYEQFLLGRNYQLRLSVRNQEIAIRFFRRAIDIDPDFARAWAMVALSEAILFRRGKRREPGLESAERALMLDPGLADAHAVKGYGLVQLGRTAEALVELDEALRLDPDSYDVRYSYGETCHLLGNYEAAIDHFERAARLLPTDYTAPAIVCMSYEALGRTEEAMSARRRALERIEQEIAVRPDNGHALMMGAVVLAYMGEKERARQWASRSQAIEPDEPIGLYNLACVLSKLGDIDQALDVLEACVPNQGPELVNWIKRDPDFDSMRTHPRYLALIARGEARLAAAQEEAPSKPS